MALKRPVRNVIGWDETVFLYENGYIDGYGNCRIFAPSGVPSVIIPPGATPLGNPASYPSEDLKAIILAKPLKADLVQLCTRAKDPRLSLYLSFYNLQRNPNSQEVFKMIQNSDEHLATWLYLRDIVTDNLKSSKPLVEGVSAIRAKYFKTAGYQIALEEFLQDGKKKVDCIQKLGANPALLSLTAFQKWLNECGLKRPMSTFLAGLTIQPITTGEINLAIMKENEPKLVEALKNFGVQKDLEAVLKSVKGYVEQTPIKSPPTNGTIYVEDVSSDLMNYINKSLGQKLTIQQLKRVTANGQEQWIEQPSSLGSIFESWVETQILIAAHKKANLGKLTFFFNEDGSISNNKANQNSKIHIIDCHYVVNQQIFAVEAKHIKGKFDKQQIIQIEKNAALAAQQKVAQVEYIFSTKAAADKNKEAIQTEFKRMKVMDKLKISFIEDVTQAVISI
jgi:hypothetical protein